MPTTDEAKLIISLEARLSKYEREMRRATQISSQTARKIENDFSKLDRSLSRMGGGLKRFGAGFIGGLGVQQITQLVRQVSAAGDAIGDLAEQTGATVESIQVLRYAAQQTGSSVEQMDTAMAKFAVNLGEAQKGSGDLAKLLKANGIALEDAAGKARSFNDIFNDVVNLVQRAPDQFAALEVVTTAFGAKNDELVTTLRDGTAGLEGWGRQLAEVGEIHGPEAIAALSELDAKWNETMKSMEGALSRLVVATGPLITFILDELSQFINTLSEIAETINLILQGKFAEAASLAQYGRAGAPPPGLYAGTVHPAPTPPSATPAVIPTKAADDAAKAAAKVEGELRQMQASLASTRKLPLNDELREALEYAAKINKLIIEVTSGGQAAKGTAGPRTGSTRHDLGRAADIQIRDPVTGRLLDSGNPADLARINQLLKTLASAGLTGFGGPGYMGPNRVHVGYGTEATWGGMPASTQQAIAEGRASPTYVAGVEGARLSAEQDVADAIIKQNEALAAQKELINQLQWDRYLEERAASIEAQTAQLDAMRDLASDVFSGIVADIRAGASAAEIFSNVLDKLISKLADMAVNMLVSSLFGPGGTAIPGLLGGLIPGRQHGGAVEAGSPYVVGETQPELFVPNVSGRIMPSVPRGLGAASASIINGQLRGVIDINPSPLFMTSVAQTSASMIAANNRRLPSYLADRQRRGI